MSRLPAVAQKIRINLDVPVSLKAEIQSIQLLLAADSMGEVVRRAVLAYSELLRLQGSGNELIIRDAAGTEAVLRFIL